MFARDGSIDMAKYEDGSCLGGEGVRRAVLGREESNSSLSASVSERERLREVVESLVRRGQKSQFELGKDGGWVGGMVVVVDGCWVEVDGGKEGGLMG